MHRLLLAGLRPQDGDCECLKRQEPAIQGIKAKVADRTAASGMLSLPRTADFEKPGDPGVDTITSIVEGAAARRGLAPCAGFPQHCRRLLGARWPAAEADPQTLVS